MNTFNDIRARIAAGMLNEDFQTALDRITSKAKEIDSMDQAHQDVITNKLKDTADYIDNFGPITTLKDYFVETKGFSEGDWTKIEKMVQKLDSKSIESFIKYVKKPVTVDYFTKMSKSTDVVASMSKDFGLDKNVTATLFNTAGEMKSGKGVGKGELFLGFMVDGATNASTGDVNVNGTPFEVKGLDARLNTQNGFGLGSAAFNSFFNALEGSKVFKGFAEKYGTKDKKNVQSYNFYRGKNKITGNNGSRLYDLFAEVPDRYHDDLIDMIANTVFCGPSGIWKNGQQFVKDVKKALKPLTMGYNAASDTMMNYELVWINMKYYQSQEYFDGIFVVHPTKGTLAYLKVGNKNMASWLSKNVKYTQPSWQDNPTSNCWKITLK